MRIALGLVTLVAGLLAVLLVASFLFNLATDGESRPVENLWHGRFVEADGLLTAYREWGSHGTPIVLIGGFVEPSFVWEDVGPLVAQEGHRVYALDLDGFGYTQRRGPWSLTEWSEQVSGFMHALAIEDPVVVGHSLGAAVAVELVRRGLVNRIVLVDGDGLGGGGAPGFIRDALSHTPLITSALRLSRRWDWPVRKLLANAYGPTHPPLDHALVEQWTDQFRADGAEHAVIELARHGIPGFTRAQLRNVRVEATVVWGDKDSVDSVTSGQHTAADLRARFVLLRGAGHLPILTNPSAVARAISCRARQAAPGGRAAC
jgi:pimeloyl-ACP methyl ester carboxylesterase